MRTQLFYVLLRLLVLAMAFPALAALQAAEATRVVKVFIFAGQSNMEGADARADQINDYPPFRGAGEPQENVLFCSLSDDALNPFNGWTALQPRRSFGPELTFARFLKKHDDAPFVIIKSAVGGTTVAFDWNPEAPDKGQKLYPRTLKLIRDALSELDKRGWHHRLEAVMWHQGENDMLNRNLNTNYAVGLNRLIGRLRADLNAPALKWFVGEVSEKGIWGMDNRANLALLRQEQEKVLKGDPLAYWVATSHLAFEVMKSGQPHYHFGTQGQLQMGEAFATAYLGSLGRSLAVEKRGFKNGLPPARNSRVRLFVLAGQRNMEGEDSFVSDIPNVPAFATLAQAQGDVLYRYALGGGFKTSSDWEPLAPVDYLGNFGPELSFGARLRKSLDSSEGLAVIKFTHSGAQGPDWFPRGSPEVHRNLYPKFIAFVREARDDLVRQGFDCRLEGIFWHVGENDTYFGPYQKSHATWMKQLIAQVRLDLGLPELPWFISEQHPKAIWRNMEPVNAGLRSLATNSSGIFIVPTAQLPHQRLHFGSEGSLRLGEELARAYLGTR